MGRNRATPETTTNSNQIPRSRELAAERQLHGKLALYLNFETKFELAKVKQRVFVWLFIQNLGKWQNSFVTSPNFLPPSHAIYIRNI